ncbi:putative GPI anchor biosynthesis protein Gwt1 [Aspergillus lucknowensis]|uniref:GPI-anchored wall transfer protein n=1 Tax=Aspergillus lucknowensis TaxID=176173 RepID=A0ABR4LGM1_9EURO
MDASYKSRKEAFVSNLAGGSALEINAVTLVAPASVFLWSVLQSRLSLFTPYGPVALITDFLLNVLAILFATTLYSSAPWLLNILLVSPALLVLLNSRPRRSQQKANPRHAAAAQDGSGGLPSLPIHPFLTTYRAAMMIITCIAILAVDFRVFPRRFAKAENWGTSLMDLGVGSFVFSGGVVSARSVIKDRRSGAPAKKTLVSRFASSMRHSVPLLVLGLIRLFSVKNLDYAEHVTEYGVHWNFFFTLGFLPPFVEIFEGLATFIPSYEILSLAVAVLYQVALESTELKSYILVSPRGTDLLSKNREGVFSFLGYLAIFLAGRAAGIRILPGDPSPSIAPQQAKKRVLSSLAAQALGCTALFALNSTYFFGYGANIPVSRRLANMPYVLWVAAFNNSQLFLFCLIEAVFFPSANRTSGTEKDKEAERTAFATSRILKAFNRGGLVVFLLANLLTGAVNLTVPTLDVSDTQGMAILIGYAAVITGIALGLDKANIKLSL